LSVVIQIKQIELREIRLPLKEPFRISSGIVEERRILLLTLLDEDGMSVMSECVAGEHPNYSPETIDTAWHAIQQWIAPRLLNRSVQHDAIYDILETDIRGHEMAKAAVEMGCWALVAEQRGISLSKLLGGTRAEVPVGISIGIQQEPDALVQRARAAHEQGYRKIKLKIMPGRDVEFVRAVRGTLPDAHLMADANNAYTIGDADHLARLDVFELMMIEQPLDHQDIVQHATLQKRLRTPICLDESITSPQRARDMIELKSGRVINVKPGRVGGFTSARRIHDIAQANHIPVWCGGMLESGVGRAYNVALASLPNFSLPGDLSPSARYWERDVVAPEWTMSIDGMVSVPTRPGIGVTIDRDRVDNLTVRTEVLK
jgi:o-succinylbenzoate synthase